MGCSLRKSVSPLATEMNDAEMLTMAGKTHRRAACAPARLKTCITNEVIGINADNAVPRTCCRSFLTLDCLLD
ncbi:hypothetical protein KCP75_21070 [Salmonella enterica subsp. enterica]|nr:hypothetical protein KCP75_21070 [Salmonella enterica subsp. enterica]